MGKYYGKVGALAARGKVYGVLMSADIWNNPMNQLASA
jgi:hypothetical protein